MANLVEFLGCQDHGNGLVIVPKNWTSNCIAEQPQAPRASLEAVGLFRAYYNQNGEGGVKKRFGDSRECVGANLPNENDSWARLVE